MTTTAQCGPNQKYCRDCGNVIFENAEICPGCGCRQIGVTINKNSMGNKFVFSTPNKADIIAGVIFNVVSCFIIHYVIIASSNMIVFGGAPFVYLLKCLVLGTLIGTAIWFGTGLLASSISAKDPKLLFIARGLIQGILVVPLVAYLEPEYLRAESSTGMVMLFALLGCGYAFGLMRFASRK